MKNLYVLSIVLLSTVFVAKAYDLRYTSNVFAEVETFKNVEFAVAPHLNTKIEMLMGYEVHSSEAIVRDEHLKMDIYLPKGDTVKKRPLILLAHGGGFVTGVRNDLEMNTWCDSLARAGYVAATFDYRLGMGSEVVSSFNPVTQTLDISINVNPINARRAVYRAVQDGNAAIRFLKSKADEYGIDTTRVYLLGSSAGGFIAIHNQYYRSASDVPEGWMDEPSLGELNSIGVQGYGSIADAYISLWGAIGNTNLLDNSNAPALFVHGSNDEVVPFKDGFSLKGLIPENPVLTLTTDLSYGSFCIDTAMTRRGIEHDTYFVEGVGHGFYAPAEGQVKNPYADTIFAKSLSFLHQLHKPMAGFSFAKDGYNVSFTSNVNEDVKYIMWDFGDGKTSTEKNPNHTYSTGGTFKAVQIVYNSIMSPDTLSATFTFANKTAVNDVLASSVQLYPNPVSSALFINAKSGVSHIKVIDLSGKTVLAFAHVNPNQSVDVSSLKAGIYIVQFDVEGLTVTKKLIKR